MQHDAADELDVVRHHVPDQLAPGDLDGGAEQAPAGLPHGGKGLRKQLVQAGRELLLVAPLQILEPALELIPLDRIGAAVLGLPNLLQLGLERAGALSQTLAKPGRLGLQLGLAQLLEPLLVAVDLVHDRLDALALPVESRAEDRRHQCLDHSGSKYNRCVVMYSATGSGTQ